MPDPLRPAAAPAALSTTALPALPTVVPPFPGEPLPVRGGEVFVRRTPWTGPVQSPADGAPRERALYVHGLGGASTNWTDLAALLAVRLEGWALDLPGFGRSRPPTRGGYALQRHTRAVVDVLEHVAGLPGNASGAPVHLVGNSLGGLISLLVAARRPDLVATLTLVSPAMPVYRVPPAVDRAVPLLVLPGVAALAERRLAGVDPEVGVRSLVEICFGDPAGIPRERYEQALEELRERGEQPWATRALTRSMRGLMTSYLRVGRRGAWAVARSVPHPALVLWGDRDRLVDPRLAPRLAAALPDARLRVLEGVGHVAMLEAPEPTARAVLGLVEGLDGARAGRTAEGPAAQRHGVPAGTWRRSSPAREETHLPRCYPGEPAGRRPATAPGVANAKEQLCPCHPWWSPRPTCPSTRCAATAAT